LILNKPCQAIISLIFFLGIVCDCDAEQINIAVASNALAAIKVIGSAFEKQTGHSVRISSGSTGKLYAQIVNGAPYDVFLAANEIEPKKLEQSSLIVPNSRFTYALGRLIVWSLDDSLLKSANIKNVIVSKSVTRIAIANPKTAPYGLAAQQVLQQMGIWKALQSNIIRGENVSQAYQFTMTNNAQIGFVAKSQILNKLMSVKGSYQEVPENLYTPIRQQAVLILHSQHKMAASEFIDFIKSDNGTKILTEQFGYGVEASGEIS
jgi:molybdate transport system substrate-binding protein